MDQTASQKRITAVVRAGLGNQLFIYAAARAMAWRTGRELRLDVRSGYRQDDYGRRFQLPAFPGIAGTWTEAEPVPARYLDKSRQPWLRSVEKRLPADWRPVIFEQRRGGPEQLTGLRPRRRDVVLVGYWQDEGYFTDCAAMIREALMPPEPEPERERVRRLGADLREAGAVMLHIRRKRYPYRLSPGYYSEALSHTGRHVGEAPVCVFGDDLDWAERQIDFGDRPVRWMTGHSDLEDLWLMTRCRHAIVANSSFSWWGGWLGGAADGATGRVVCAPESFGFPIRPARGWRTIDTDFEPPVGREAEKREVT